MRTFFHLVWMTAALAVAAAWAEDIHTRMGTVSNAVIVSSNDQGISVRSSTGVSFYKYSELDAATRLKHGFPEHESTVAPVIVTNAPPAPEAGIRTTNLNGRTYYFGPKGGRYYVNKSGKKVYE